MRTVLSFPSKAVSIVPARPAPELLDIAYEKLASRQ